VGTYKTYTLQTPEESVSYWNQGSAYQVKTIDSVEVELSYLKYFDKSYVFQLKVSNGSGQALYFDPARITAGMYKNDSCLEYIVLAINPEVKLNEIDTHIKEEKARIARNATFGILEGIFCAVADVSVKDTEENQKKKEAMWAAQDGLSQMHGQNISDAQLTLMNLRDGIPYWEESVLRKTTIFPEHYHDGYLHIALNYAPLIKISVPVEGRTFEFEYQMHLVKPYGY
jgi:hypothetical protein